MYKVFALTISLSLLAAATFPRVFAQEHIVTPIPNSPDDLPKVEGALAPITHQVVVKATVPLSDLWASEIKKNSEVFVSEQSQVGSEVIFGATIRGLDQKLMANDKVKAEVLRDGEKVDEIAEVTTEDGNVFFPFIPLEPGKYEVQFVYDEHERKVTLDKKIYFSMTPEQALLWQ